MIDECVAGLESIGALPRCAGLLTGYLGKAEIGEAALGALAAHPGRQSGRRLRLRSGDRRCRARFMSRPASPNSCATAPCRRRRLRRRTPSNWNGWPAARSRCAGARRDRRRCARAAPASWSATSLPLEDTAADALDIMAGDVGPLAAAHAKTADRRQWRRRPVRGPVLPSLAGRPRGAAGARRRPQGLCVVAATAAAGASSPLVAAQDEIVNPSETLSPRRRFNSGRRTYFLRAPHLFDLIKAATGATRRKDEK